MSSFQSSPQNPLDASNIRSLMSAANGDNAITTAKPIGTLNRSSAPVTFKYKDKLDKTDRVDFLRIDLAPGSGFSSTRNALNVKGGGINVTTFLALPGAPQQRVDVTNFGVGSNAAEINTPFSNVFGGTVQLFFRIRIRRPRDVKKVNYSINLTFNP